MTKTREITIKVNLSKIPLEKRYQPLLDAAIAAGLPVDAAVYRPKAGFIELQIKGQPHRYFVLGGKRFIDGNINITYAVPEEYLTSA